MSMNEKNATIFRYIRINNENIFVCVFRASLNARCVDCPLCVRGTPYRHGCARTLLKVEQSKRFRVRLLLGVFARSRRVEFGARKSHDTVEFGYFPRVGRIRVGIFRRTHAFPLRTIVHDHRLTLYRFLRRDASITSRALA